MARMLVIPGPMMVANTPGLPRPAVRPPFSRRPARRAGDSGGMAGQGRDRALALVCTPGMKTALMPQGFELFDEEFAGASWPFLSCSRTWKSRESPRLSGLWPGSVALATPAFAEYELTVD